MPRFKKLPEVVDAVQWHEGDPPLEGMRDSSSQGRYCVVLYGNVIGGPVHDGYWLVTDWKGNRQAYPPDVFEKMFESVE